MSTWWCDLESLATDELGVTSLEYALLGGLIAVVIAGAVGALGASVNALFQKVVDAWP